MVWWKLQQITLSHISKLARKYFCITSTSSSLESLFSTTRNTVTCQGIKILEGIRVGLPYQELAILKKSLRISPGQYYHKTKNKTIKHTSIAVSCCVKAWLKK